ncbi:YraN family protein [Candidatus Uhrbacteria bacterium]|jgi:putative endonuclease|nr:YraN family protein [Candidatus Uhrbacteria bacterium]
MVHSRRKFGDQGEKLAASYLNDKGFRVVDTQHRTPYGEIDLICRDGEEVVFVEVKTRRSRRFGFPEESVTAAKILRIVRSAEHILQERKWIDIPWRVDVVSVEFDHETPVFTHLKGIDMPEGSW